MQWFACWAYRQSIHTRSYLCVRCHQFVVGTVDFKSLGVGSCRRAGRGVPHGPGGNDLSTDNGSCWSCSAPKSLGQYDFCICAGPHGRQQWDVSVTSIRSNLSRLIQNWLLRRMLRSRSDIVFELPYFAFRSANNMNTSSIHLVIVQTQCL